MQYPFSRRRSWGPALCLVAAAALSACGGGGGATSTMGASGTPAAGVAINDTSAAGLRGADFQVNTGTAGDQYGAQVARLSDGGFVAAWSSYSGSASEIRLQRFDAAGQPAGGEQLVGNGSHAQVTAFADGRFLVTWRFSPYIYTVLSHGQFFDAQGQALGAAFELGTGYNNFSGRPLALPDGGFVFVAESNPGRYAATYTIVRRFSATGVPQGPGTQLAGDLIPVTSGYDMNYAGNGTVAVLADGRIAVAWRASGSSTNQLRLSLFDAQANPIGAYRVLADEAGVEATSVVALPDGGYAVAWETGLPGQSRSAQLEVVDAAGTSLGRRTLAADPAAYYVTPQLALLADGSLAATWRATRYGTDTAQRDTYAQRFTAAGAPIGSPQALPSITTPAGASAGSHAVAGLSGDQMLLLYGSWSANDGAEVRATVR